VLIRRGIIRFWISALALFFHSHLIHLVNPSPPLFIHSRFCFFTGVNNTYPSMGMGGIEEDRRRNAMEDYLSMALGGVEGV